MINHNDRHPLAGGNFKNYEGEIVGARNLCDSRGFEARARQWEGFAEGSARKVAIARKSREEWQEVVDDLTLKVEWREEAAEVVRNYSEKVLPHFEGEERDARDRAAKFKAQAEQARAFETRWNFDVYGADSKLDPLRRELAGGIELESLDTTNEVQK